MADLLSMTGYGHGEATAGLFRITCDVRSVNHRYLDVQPRLPRELMAVEPELVRLVKEYIDRGRVEIHVRYDSGASSAHELVVDQQLAQDYQRTLGQLAKALGRPTPEPDVWALASLDGVMRLQPRAPGEETGPAVREALDQALKAHHDMRRDEGGALVRDLRHQLESITVALSEVGKRADGQLERQRQRLLDRMQAVLASADVVLDPDRILAEAACLAERSDINEEIVRLQQHLRVFGEELDAGGRVGRKLDFLAQEMLREANTMGSKSSEAELSHLVVAIKNDIERIREQVQNIE